MYFVNFITYRRDGDRLEAFQVQRGHGYESVRLIPFAPLFEGHCGWIADDIADYERRMAARPMVKKAA